jgi:choline dehydrogenase-like flavoprotein
MATKLKPVDVVLVGFGWTASILAQELTDAGLEVLALERGKFRDTVPNFSTAFVQDELKYALRHELFEEPRQEAQVPQPDRTADAASGFVPSRRRCGWRGGALEWSDMALFAY